MKEHKPELPSDDDSTRLFVRPEVPEPAEAFLEHLKKRSYVIEDIKKLQGHLAAFEKRLSKGKIV